MNWEIYLDSSWPELPRTIEGFEIALKQEYEEYLKKRLEEIRKK